MSLPGFPGVTGWFLFCFSLRSRRSFSTHVRTVFGNEIAHMLTTAVALVPDLRFFFCVLSALVQRPHGSLDFTVR